jgi:hypothetical protein
MYSLPQAGILSNQLLKKRLTAKGYYQCQHTPGLQRQVWQNITFCLVVDDFGIKVNNMHNMDHLIDALKKHYTVAVNMTGSLFCRIQLTWNYVQGHVDCHMLGYINKALTKYQHPNRSLLKMLPTKRQQSNMAQEFREWRLTPHNHSPQKKTNTIKTLLEPSCTMREQLIQYFLLHSAPSQHKPTAHVQWWMHVTNSLITLPLTQMLAFDTKLATWYYWYTQTPPTFPILVVKAEWQNIFTYRIAMSKTSTMAPYSHC